MAQQAVATGAVSVSTLADMTFANYLALPTIGKNGEVNLHLKSCMVARAVLNDPNHCGCATVVDVRGEKVRTTLLQFMLRDYKTSGCRYDFVSYVHLFVGQDDAAAKLAMLQEMKTYAETKLMTPMPPATLEDVVVIQRELEAELDKYPSLRARFGLD